MELTDKLISLRKENGLTQLELAEKMDVSRQTISRWESGEVFPSSDNLRRLGELYGVSVGYLMSNDAEQLTTAVAVVEKLKPEKPWRKPALIAIVASVILLAFFIGLMTGKSKKEKSPNETTIPFDSLQTDILNEEDFEEPADFIGW